MERYEQIASGGHWLYDGYLLSDEVVFMSKASRPVGIEPFLECTNEQKEQWEREHPQPEPENIENNE